MKKRAAIYCRLSKDSEGLGLGVERQEKACRELAERRKLDVAHVFTDNDIGAYKGRKRAAYEAMQESLPRRTGRRPDLLGTGSAPTRHVRELEDLIDLLDEHRVEVETCTAGVYDLRTPTGRMQARIVGTVGRFESEHKGERQRAKGGRARSTRMPAGGRAPYGYRWEHPERDRGKGRLLIDATEAKHLRWMGDPRARRLVDAPHSPRANPQRRPDEGGPTLAQLHRPRGAR